MEVNFDELRDWSDGARRALDRERERMMEQMKMLDGLARATEVIGDIQAENERLQAEVDDLNEQLEQRDQEIDDLRRQHQQEIDDLQRQLLEARNQHLESKQLTVVRMNELASKCFTKQGEPLKLAKPRREYSADADEIENFLGSPANPCVYP